MNFCRWSRNKALFRAVFIGGRFDLPQLVRRGDWYVRVRFVTCKQQLFDRVQRSAVQLYRRRPPFSFPLTVRLIAIPSS